MPEASEKHRIERIDIRRDFLPRIRFEKIETSDNGENKQSRETDPDTSGEEHGDKGETDDADPCTRCRIPVTAERDVDIILQPVGKGHVPAFPESACILGLIRGVEVLGEIKAHQHRDPRCDVRISGKVRIDLKGIAEKG